MTTSKIDGVEKLPLRWIPDERGKLMVLLRNDDNCFQKFGQVYVTTCLPGRIKGFHGHRYQWDYQAVMQGMVKLVLWDSRENSPTYKAIEEIFIGDDNPMLVVIPPMVLHGIKAYGRCPAYLINIPTELYNNEAPDELRIAPYDDEIGYDWRAKDG